VLTIGSDPEFVIYDSSGFVPAYDVVPESTSRQIGVDGCSSTGELRPTYARDPLTHFNNVKRLVQRLSRDYLKGEYNAYAGSYHNSYPLGGHIHFGAKGYNFDKTVAALDLISVFLQPLEDYDYNVKRRSTYGRLSDTRYQPHGIEYRTPPSWLVHPAICKGYLCLYYITAAEIVAGHKNKLLDKLIDEFLLERNEIYKEFPYAKVTHFARKNANRIKRAITHMKLYPEYQQYIRTLFSLIKLGKTFTQFAQTPFQRTWNCVPSAPVPALEFNLNDHKLKEISEMIKIPRRKTTPIYVFGLRNEDRPPLVCSPELKERVEKAAREAGLDKKVPDFTVLVWNSFRRSVGIRWDLREHHTELVALFLSKLVSR